MDEGHFYSSPLPTSGDDDLGLTLIFFYGKVKFAFWCFYDEMLEHKNSWKLFKILAY